MMKREVAVLSKSVLIMISRWCTSGWLSCPTLQTETISSDGRQVLSSNYGTHEFGRPTVYFAWMQ